MRLKTTILLALLYLTSSCGGYFNQPLGVQKAVIGKGTPASGYLRSLPVPKEQIVVGVYKFRDQTGQYKSSETGSTFSTAVTQGATSILIKALEDSKWFVPIERENLGNLLNERNIIRSTRQEYLKSANTNEPQLTPLLYAGVLLEGGIVSYDTNIMTGGFGARYFGAGASTKYRQDRVTIYLRLVSTSNGKILKTVYISKTILSQAIDASLFRYVNFKRLLEVETGFTKNEPIHLAVTEAIEKAVHALVIEGIRDDVWKSSASPIALSELITNYNEDKDEAESIVVTKKQDTTRRSRNAVTLSTGVALIDGDYKTAVFKPLFSANFNYFLNSNFSLNPSLYYFSLSNTERFNSNFTSLDLNVSYFITPNYFFSPYVYLGPGIGTTGDFSSIHYKFQFGVGMEFLFSNTLGVRAFGEQNSTFSDKIDERVGGSRNDFYWRIGFGLTWYISNKKVQKTLIKK
jgi:curli production assembly/transport component CsgG